MTLRLRKDGQPYRKVGRKGDPRRKEACEEYSARPSYVYHADVALLDQLDRCKNDAARRILLGTGRKRA